MDVEKWPEWLKTRAAKYDALKASKGAAASGAVGPQSPIKVTLPDGKVVDAVAFKTTPLDVANSISQGLARAVIVASVDEAAWDLSRPLEKDCHLQLYKFDSPEGAKTFWHSSAHILGEALEILFDAHLCVGPPLKEGGFYYEATIPGGENLSSDHFAKIDAFVKSIADAKQPFERLVVTKDEALDLFSYNKYKSEIVRRKVTDNTLTTVYRCGPLIDLCKGPHLANTGLVKAFEATKVSSSYFLGDAKNDTLQRIYGISFPDVKLMKEHKHKLEEAAKRDHRRIGVQQELFFFNDLSPGSAFFLPNGAKIYNRLVEMIRKEYRKRGYQEVISPNVFKSNLWVTSGHWEHYKDNMFTFESEGEKFGLKPMNCPGHCCIFKHGSRSYKELPLRMAEFGVLHRNELSGTLSGLTRVRKFVQDDTHIFCTPGQVQDEVMGCLDFMSYIYKMFHFEFDLELSTRPKAFMGELAVWDRAEDQLKSALNAFGHPWKLNPGDGAFYGPKIDIHIRDALGRSFQCATVQVDFQLPLRFELEYQNEKGVLEKPVIVHRAILGSLERFLGILIEHTAGLWPFWLSPRQICVVTVLDTPDMTAYAQEVRFQLHSAGFDVDVDDSGDKINKKIRNAEVRHYNFILVVGKTEVENKTVNVRSGRSNEVLGEKTIPKVVEEFQELVHQFK